MKYEFSRQSASAGVCAAIATRLFWGTMLDPSVPMEGTWLSVLLGCAVALPLTLLAMRFRSSKCLSTVLLLILLPDAAATMECTAFSESYLAYSHIAVVILLLPLLVASLRCTALGGNALGSSARIWMYVLAFLLAVVIVCQFPRFRPGWLFPLLGSGAGPLLKLSLRSAWWIAMLGSAAVLLCQESPRGSRVGACMAIASASAAALIALRLMMTPAQALTRMDRTMLLDSLLTNGRAPLTLQLPMVLIWFIGMLHLFCFESFLCAALLKRCVKRLPDALCNMLTAACIFAMAALRLYDSPLLSQIMNMTLPLLLILTVIVAMANHRKDGSAACAD